MVTSLAAHWCCMIASWSWTLIELTLIMALFVVRAAQSLAEAEAILAEWQAAYEL